MATTLNQAAQSAQRLKPRPFHREEGEKKHRVAGHRTGDDRTGRDTTDMATASLSDVAEGMGRKLRTLQAYRSGFRDVTPDAARSLAAYLRKRARLLQRAADSLEAAAERATRKEEDDATP